jgi:NAD-dependent SIR2 family protein deacetylase
MEHSFQSPYETAANPPRCRHCREPVGPHVVWFGEVPLDMKGIDREINNATLVLAVDTSGYVYPATDSYIPPITG